MMTKAEPLLSPKFALVLQFANEIHNQQVRKRLGAPFISHSMAVCAIELEYGGDENQAIAALLRDSAEGCCGHPMLQSALGMFGDDVTEIIEACTDTFEKQKPEWRPRKLAHRGALKEKPGRMKFVSCADKLHDVGNILRNIERGGVTSRMEQMAQSKNGAAEKQIWYCTGCLEAFASNRKAPVRNELGRAVVQLNGFVGSPAHLARSLELSKGGFDARE